MRKQTQAVQKLRVTFGVASPIRYVSVLDMGRLWERLLRRARVPLAYTQGFNPHPRMQFAAALPVGYSSEGELLDLFLGERLDPAEAARAMAAQAPQGLSILRVEEAPLDGPAPQTLIQWARYRVEVETPAGSEEIDAALERLMSRPTILRQRIKKGQMAEYDLRPLIGQIARSTSQSGHHELYMVLRCGQEGAGRPEEVMAALDLAVNGYDIRRLGLWGEREM